MMQVIADYTLKVFLTFYILQVGPPKSHGAPVNFLPTLGCINNALITLINALKKLMQCVMR